MRSDVAERDRVGDPLEAEAGHQPIVEGSGIVIPNRSLDTFPLCLPPSALDEAAVARLAADDLDEGHASAIDRTMIPRSVFASSQYSEASITVMTRRVTAGSAGSGE